MKIWVALFDSSISYVHLLEANQLLNSRHNFIHYNVDMHINYNLNVWAAKNAIFHFRWFRFRYSIKLFTGSDLRCTIWIRWQQQINSTFQFKTLEFFLKKLSINTKSLLLVKLVREAIGMYFTFLISGCVRIKTFFSIVGIRFNSINKKGLTK